MPSFVVCLHIGSNFSDLFQSKMLDISKYFSQKAMSPAPM